MRTFLLNGKKYLVPPDKVAEFDAFIQNDWAPNFPTQWMIDDDKSQTTRKERVTASFRSMCFSMELSKWAAEKWIDYVVDNV